MEGQELRTYIKQLRANKNHEGIIDVIWRRYLALNHLEEHEGKLRVIRSEVVETNPQIISKAQFYRYVKGFKERFITETGHHETAPAMEVLELAKGKDVPMSAMVSKLKNHTYRLMAGADVMAETGVVMIVYYGRKIQETIHTAGGIECLRPIHIAKINIYEDKLMKYYGMVSDYIKPSAIAKYLKLLGLEDVAGAVPDDLELGTLTPASLLKQLKEVGMKGVFGNTELLLSLEESVNPSELPEIDAQLVKDEENEEMNNRMRDERLVKKKTLEDLDN